MEHFPGTCFQFINTEFYIWFGNEDKDSLVIMQAACKPLLSPHLTVPCIHISVMTQQTKPSLMTQLLDTCSPDNVLCLKTTLKNPAISRYITAEFPNT